MTRQRQRAGRELHPSLNVEEAWLKAVALNAPAKAGAYEGKWMPRVPAASVDEIWSRVVEATRAGRLGIGAKVSTRFSNRFSPRSEGADTHVICVYTADCRDMAEVRRVLVELRRMGFRERLSYKENGATAANVYGPGAALYVAQPDSLEPERRREPIPDPEGT